MKKANSKGFTLMELMVTLALAAAVAAIAIPNIQIFVRNGRLSGTANDLLQSLYLARSEAIKNRLPTTWCLSSDSTASSPACSHTTSVSGSTAGWLVFVDSNGSGAVDAGETVLQRYALDNYSGGRQLFYVVANGDGIYGYGADGFGRPNVGTHSKSDNFVIFDSRLNQAVGNLSTARAVDVSSSGRPMVHSLKSKLDDVCTNKVSCTIP